MKSREYGLRAVDRQELFDEPARVLALGIAGPVIIEDDEEPVAVLVPAAQWLAMDGRSTRTSEALGVRAAEGGGSL